MAKCFCIKVIVLAFAITVVAPTGNMPASAQDQLHSEAPVQPNQAIRPKVSGDEKIQMSTGECTTGRARCIAGM